MHLTALFLGWFYASCAYHVLMMIICFSVFYGNIMFLMLIIYKDSAFCTLVRSKFSWYTKHTGQQLVIFVFGKSNIMEQSSYTYSTRFTIWWAGPVRYLCQDLMTSGLRKSKTIKWVIMQKFNQSKYPKQVLFRSYVFVLGENSFSTTGNGPWNTSISLTLIIKISYSPIFQNCIQDRLVQDQFQGLPYIYKSLIILLWNCLAL